MANAGLPHLPLPGEKPATIYRPEGSRAARRRLPAGFFRWIALILILVLAAFLLWRSGASGVTVIVNGLPRHILTRQPTVEAVLRARGVETAGATHVSPALDAPVTAGMTITLISARPALLHVGDSVFRVEAPPADLLAAVSSVAVPSPSEALVVRRQLPSALSGAAIIREAAIVPLTRVIVTEDGGEVSFTTAEPTLGEALAAAGFTLYQSDRLDPPPWTPLDGGDIRVTIARAVPVTLFMGDTSIQARTSAATISVLLAEQGLALTGADYLSPSPGTLLAEGMVIHLTRVEQDFVTETEQVPAETIYTADPAMEIDQLRRLREGVDGIIERRYAVRYEDGREVSRVLVGEWSLREPVPGIIAYGTKIVIRTLETPEGDFAYWRTLRVLATSYSPSTAGHKQPGDPGFGISGTGAEVVRGIVAVDPRVINLYQWMYIPGYGVGRALDTGGAVKGLRVDLGYSDADFFHRYEWITIYLITPVPPAAEINWILPDQEVG